MTEDGTYVMGDTAITGDTLTAQWTKNGELAAMSTDTVDVTVEETEGVEIDEVDPDGEYYYEFTMNGEYLIRLFDETEPYECNVSVNTTVGGSLRFYVGTQRVYPTGGKITEMSGIY